MPNDNEPSYGKVVLTRIQYRLLNVLSVIFPPAGLVLFFAYKASNGVQSSIFLFWAFIGALLYIGVL